MKYAGLAVLVAVLMGVSYYTGVGAGVNRASEQTEVKTSEMEAKINTLVANYNGLIQGLQQQFGAANQKDSNQVMSMALLERVVRKDIGQRKYESYLKESREELAAEMKKLDEARKEAAAKASAAEKVQP